MEQTGDMNLIFILSLVTTPLLFVGILLWARGIQRKKAEEQRQRARLLGWQMEEALPGTVAFRFRGRCGTHEWTLEGTRSGKGSRSGGGSTALVIANLAPPEQPFVLLTPKKEMPPGLDMGSPLVQMALRAALGEEIAGILKECRPVSLGGALGARFSALAADEAAMSRHLKGPAEGVLSEWALRQNLEVAFFLAHGALRVQLRGSAHAFPLLEEVVKTGCKLAQAWEGRP